MWTGMKQSALVKESFSKNDICFIVLMAFVWSENILLRYIRVFLMKVPYIWQQVDTIMSLIFLVFLCLSLGSIIRELYVKEFFIALGIYVVFCLHYYIFPLNESYYSEYKETVINDTFPMFLTGILVFRIERKRILKVLSVISLVTIVAFAGYILLYQTMEGTEMRGGDMHAAYLILPHICLVYYTVVLRANPWNIGAFLIGVVTLLFLGNRGSLLCLGIFVIFTILFSGRLKHPILFLVLSVGVMVVLFAFGALDFLYKLAEQNGFSLRIFEKLEKGEITDSSGRDKLRERVVEYILLYPMMGMGIFSDRRIAGGLYAHNIILEIVLHFGMVLGTVILVLVFYLLIVAFLHLRKKRDVMTVGFFSAMVFSHVIKLFLSSSYLVEPYFFFAVGFAYASVQEWKITRKQTKKARKTLERGEVKVHEERNESLCDCYQLSMVRSSSTETD